LPRVRRQIVENALVLWEGRRGLYLYTIISICDRYVVLQQSMLGKQQLLEEQWWD